MEYSKTKDQFKLEEFTEEVIYHRDMALAFTEYKQTYQNAKDFNIDDEFDIHFSAIKKQEHFLKKYIKTG